MRAINLLPSSAAARKSFKDEDPAVVVGSALGAVVILALGAGFLNVHSKVGHEQQKLDAAREQLAQLSNRHIQLPKSPTKPVKQVAIVPVPAVTQEAQPRLDALTSAMSQRISWDRVLREFSQVLPSDVSITSLQLDAPTAPVVGTTTTTAGTGLSVSGNAYSHDGVARFLSRLELIPDLDDVTLSNSNADGGTVQFSITAAIKGAPAPVTPPAATTTTATTTTATTTTTNGSSQ